MPNGDSGCQRDNLNRPVEKYFIVIVSERFKDMATNARRTWEVRSAVQLNPTAEASSQFTSRQEVIKIIWKIFWSEMWNCYFHHEGVIELFRTEVFPEFLSQRAQPEGSNYPENPRPEKLNRHSGEQCF